jgi:hypothetical protein
MGETKHVQTPPRINSTYNHSNATSTRYYVLGRRTLLFPTLLSHLGSTIIRPLRPLSVVAHHARKGPPQAWQASFKAEPCKFSEDKEEAEKAKNEKSPTDSPPADRQAGNAQPTTG